VFATSDTIVAIATPPGRGGIGVVRLSGPAARDVARAIVTRKAPLEPRVATFTTVVANPRPAAAISDHAVVTWFPAPASYTGDDVVEVSVHGSPVILGAIVEAAVGAGARCAEPGEFTLRAYLNGRIDLMQAEAVADLIDAVTPLQARVAFDQLQGTLTERIRDIDERLFDLIARLEASVDFPDEGYHFVEPGALAGAIDRLMASTGELLATARRGRLIREGTTVAIVGSPNVGKSSLFNALVGADRAIVTEVPGTTRDLVSETIDIEGVRVTLVDTAGLRETADPIEAEGVARSRQAAATADLHLLVLEPVEVGARLVPGTCQARAWHVDIDAFDPILQVADYKRLVVVNKIDVVDARGELSQELPLSPGTVAVSARTGDGLDALRTRIAATLSGDDRPAQDTPTLTNVRHITLVRAAHEALGRARDAALANGRSLSEEFVLADLQAARSALEEVTGTRAPDDVLTHIFERFCIGK
jgi:tRNA modification GTPase